MDLVGDRRGQSIQIGAILLFAVLIIAFASYQAVVVPNQNRGVEFNHNQQVQSDMQDLRNAIVSARGTGEDRSVSVQLGTRYPSRLVARNPSPPSGSLNTVGTTDERVDLTIANAQAAGETGDFWNESQSYNTGGLVYQPNYNVYANPPTTIYEQTVLYNRFPTGNITLSEQSFIDGTDISLVAINGSVSASSTQATSVDVRSVSSSTERVRLDENSTGPITITFASQRSAAYWDFLEASQSATVEQVTDTSSGDGFYNVSVELDPDRTYNLQLTKVGVGSGVTDEDAAYLTDVEGDGATVSQGETTELTLDVRDRFNNPPDNVAQLQVNGSVDGGGSLQSNSKTPDEDGEVTFTYEAPSSGTGTQEVEFSYTDSGTGLDTSTPQNVSMSVDVTAASDGGGGGGSGAGAGNGGTSTYSPSEDTVTVTGGNGLWTGITYTDQLRFSDAVPTLTTENGYDRVRTSATFRNDTHNYTVRVKIDLEAEGEFNVRSVLFRERIGGATDSNEYTLTAAAARKIFDSPTYDGLNVLEPTNYESPDGVSRTADAISQLDGSDVEVLFSNTEGRTSATLWDRTLITAVQPDPAALSDNDDGEFVALHFRTPVDTAGWTIENDAGDTTNLPDRELSGTVYFAKNEPAFESEYGFADGAVYELNTPLGDDGEQVILTDADGDRRDEFAHGAAQTSRGWSLADLAAGEVANRSYDREFYVDSNAASDWTVEDESSYFDGSGGGGGQTLQADESAGVSTQSGELVFSIENTGDSEVTVENFSVDATALGSGIELQNGNDPELEIRGGTGAEGDGSANAPGNGNTFAADGQVYDLNNNGGSYAGIGAGDTGVEVDIRAFDPRIDPLEFADSEADADVVVTLGLSDGTEQEFYFRQP